MSDNENPHSEDVFFEEHGIGKAEIKRFQQQVAACENLEQFTETLKSYSNVIGEMYERTVLTPALTLLQINKPVEIPTQPNERIKLFRSLLVLLKRTPFENGIRKKLAELLGVADRFNSNFLEIEI